MIESQTSGILKRKRFKLRCSKPVFTACTLRVSISNGRYPGKEKLPSILYISIYTHHRILQQQRKEIDSIVVVLRSFTRNVAWYYIIHFPLKPMNHTGRVSPAVFSGLLVSDNRKSCGNSYCVTTRSLSSFNLTREKHVSFLRRLTKSADKPLSGMLSETTAVVKTQPL